MFSISSKSSLHLSRWPTWLSRWLGYRTSQTSDIPRCMVWAWAFIATVGALAAIQALFGQANCFIEKGFPVIVSSFSASAVLIFSVVDSPLAQPRSLFGGHLIGAATGVSITKLFLLLPSTERFEQLNWLASTLSCALTIILMDITGTTHPPGGATAFLAALNPQIREIGWYYLPVVLLSATLALSVALLTMNIQRRYPLYWFTPPTSSTPLLPLVEERTAAIPEVTWMPGLEKKVHNITLQPIIWTN